MASSKFLPIARGVPRLSLSRSGAAVACALALVPPGCGAPAARPAEPTFRELEFPEDAIVTTKEVGALAGEASVQPNGSFRYHVPLWVPRGRAGMQPEVSLSYDSHSGDGVLGVGWSLNAGQTAIMRCNRLYARDGVADGIRFDDSADIFCLGSEKLVEVGQGELPENYDPPVSGTVMAEYRTEQDEHARVLAYGDGDTIASWDVLLPNGRIRRYGDSTLSRLEAERFQLTGIVTLGWLLAAEYDRSENEIRYNYLQPDPTSATRLLSEIEYTLSDDAAYTTAAIRRVLISHVPKPDTRVTYRGGLKFVHDRRIGAIRMQAPNPDLVNTVRSYELHYEQSQRTGRSIITSIEECEGGTNPKCLPETVFEYAQPSGTEAVQFVTHHDANLTGITDPWQDSLGPVGDYNGDGFDDLLVLKQEWGHDDGNDVYGTVPEVWFSDGTLSSFTTMSLGNVFGINDDGVHYRRANTFEQPYGTKATAADIDADGASELVVRTREGAYPHAYRWRAVGMDETTGAFSLGAALGMGAYRLHGTSDTPIAQPVVYGDVDGDGLVDIYTTQDHDGFQWPTGGWNYKGEWHTYRNQPALPGSYVDTTSPATHWLALANSGLSIDLRGTGRKGLADLNPSQEMMFSEPDLAAGTFSSAATPADMHEYFGEASTYLDINGDGLADYLKMTETETSRPRVQLNTGNGFDVPHFAGAVSYPWPLNSWGPPGGEEHPNPDGRAKDGLELRVADFNGDGLDDLLVLSRWAQNGEDHKDVWGAGYANPRIWLSDGEGFVEVDGAGDALEHISTNAIGRFANLRLADVDNDGLVDIVDLGPYGIIEQHIFDQRPGCGEIAFCTGLEYYQLSISKDAGGPDGKFYDRIVSVTTGTGTHDTVEYGPHSPTDVNDPDPTYVAGDGCTYPESCARRGSPVVVSHVRHNPGGALPHETQYRYEDRRRHLAGRGSLGFAKVTATDVTSGQVIETLYDQTPYELGPGHVYPEAGMPVERTTYRSDALSSSTKTLVETFDRDVILLGDRYRVRDVATVRDSYEDGVLAERTVEEVVERDAYDFAKRIEHTVSGGTTTVTVRTYDHRPEDAMLGLQTLEVVTKTNAQGTQTRQTSASYDARGRVESEVVGGGSPVDRDTQLTTTVAYGPGGVVETSTRSNWDASDVRIEITTWDEDGVYPTHVTNAVGHTREVQYHPAVDQIVAQSEPYIGTAPATLHATTHQYDGVGRLRRTTKPDGTFEEVERFYVDSMAPTAGWYAQTTNEDGQWTREYRDVRNRVFRETASGPGGGETGTLMTFDARGREVQRWLPTDGGSAPSVPKVVTTTYDNYDRVTSVTHPDGVTTTTYPNVLSVERTDPVGRTIRQTHNFDGHTVVTRRTVDGVDQYTAYAYSPFGELVRITDPAGNETSYVHDRLGRIVETTAPDTGTTLTDHNPFGELYRVEDAEGNVRSTYHDAIGRPTVRLSEDGVDLYTYDVGVGGVDRLHQAISADGIATTHQHDEFGRVVRTEVESGGVAYATEFEFDSVTGKLIRTLYPELDDGYQLVVSRSYAADGRLQQIVDTDTGHVYWEAVERDDMDRVRRARLGEVETVVGYSALTDRIETFDAVLSAGPSVVSRGYTYDPDGRLATASDGATSASPILEEMDYDGLGRLTHWRATRGAAPTVERRYDYTTAGSLALVQDFVGGVPIDAGTSYGYASGRPHIADTVGDRTFQHDAAGREQVALANGEIIRQLDFNSRDLPYAGEVDGEGIKLRYDAFGTRFDKSVGEDITRYWGPLYEQRETSEGTTDVLYVDGPDGRIAHVERLEGDNRIKTLVVDPRLGSTVAIVDGSSVSRAHYAAFGARVDAAGTLQSGVGSSPDLVTVGYTGHEHDDALGLINMKGRMYDPATRRMLTADPVRGPVELGRGFSPYEYVHDDPFNAIDPTGFQAAPTEPMMSELMQAQTSPEASMEEQALEGHKSKQYSSGTETDDGTAQSANVSRESFSQEEYELFLFMRELEERRQTSLSDDAILEAWQRRGTRHDGSASPGRTTTSESSQPKETVPPPPALGETPRGKVGGHLIKNFVMPSASPAWLSGQKPLVTRTGLAQKLWIIAADVPLIIWDIEAAQLDTELGAIRYWDKRDECAAAGASCGMVFEPLDPGQPHHWYDPRDGGTCVLPGCE